MSYLPPERFGLLSLDVVRGRLGRLYLLSLCLGVRYVGRGLNRVCAGIYLAAGRLRCLRGREVVVPHVWRKDEVRFGARCGARESTFFFNFGRRNYHPFHFYFIRSITGRLFFLCLFEERRQPRPRTSLSLSPTCLFCVRFRGAGRSLRTRFERVSSLLCK